MQEKALEKNRSVGFTNFQKLLLVLKQSKTTDFQTKLVHRDIQHYSKWLTLS